MTKGIKQTSSTGLSSREGEEVLFTEEISTIESPKINEWLTLVEKQMRITLASYLANAVKDIKQFKEGPINAEEYMKWCDRYQAQIVVLAAQILWSEDVEEALVHINNSGDRNMKPLEHVLNQVIFYYLFLLTEETHNDTISA